MSAEKSTLEMCQVWMTKDGQVVRVVRGSTPIDEYVGMSLTDLKTQLEADGWKETARFSVADEPNQTQVSFRRNKS